MSDIFWEDVAYQLLEHNLNGDSLNAHMLTDIFKARPDVLAGIDFGEGVKIESLDQQMYSGSADIVEVREAKQHELWQCMPCNRTFRRKDNLDRHLRSSLHERRLKKFMEKKVEKEQEEAKAAEPKEVVVL
jgi:uncharacterized C2H2 Zn-finger protein